VGLTRSSSSFRVNRVAASFPQLGQKQSIPIGRRGRRTSAPVAGGPKPSGGTSLKDTTSLSWEKAEKKTRKLMHDGKDKAEVWSSSREKLSGGVRPWASLRGSKRSGGGKVPENRRHLLSP